MVLVGCWYGCRKLEPMRLSLLPIMDLPCSVAASYDVVATMLLKRLTADILVWAASWQHLQCRQHRQCDSEQSDRTCWMTKFVFTRQRAPDAFHHQLPFFLGPISTSRTWGQFHEKKLLRVIFHRVEILPNFNQIFPLVFNLYKNSFQVEIIFAQLC